jgi:ankyrin repeat protein
MHIKYSHIVFDERPLFLAALAGHYDPIRHLDVDDYDDIIDRRTIGCTIWHYLAASGNYAALAQAIADHPRILELEYDCTISIWHYLALSGNSNALAQAIASHPRIIHLDDENGNSIWHYFALSGNYTALKEFIEYYIYRDINIPDNVNNDEDTIWHYLAQSGNYKSLKQAMKDRPEIKNIKNDRKDTIFHFLAISGNYDSLKKAIKDIPNITSINNKNDQTIWHYLARSCNYQVLKQALIDYPDIIYLKDDDNHTIFDQVGLSSSYDSIKQVADDFPEYFNIDLIFSLASTINYKDTRLALIDYHEEIKGRDYQDIFTCFEEDTTRYSRYYLKLFIDEGFCKLSDFSDETKKEIKQFIKNYNVVQKFIKEHGKPDLSRIPTKYICSISQDLIEDPVVTEYGNMYDRKSIEKWFENSDIDPLNGLKVQSRTVHPVLPVIQDIYHILNTLYSR